MKLRTKLGRTLDHHLGYNANRAKKKKKKKSQTCTNWRAERVFVLNLGVGKNYYDVGNNVWQQVRHQSPLDQLRHLNYCAHDSCPTSRTTRAP